MSGECDECGKHCLECICKPNCRSQKNGWISVKYNPNENQDVLMTYNDLVMEGKFVNGKFYHPSVCAHVPGYCNCEYQEGITHWMPLPEPPNEFCNKCKNECVACVC
jgi:Protein of unknown function (DUF551)